MKSYLESDDDDIVRPSRAPSTRGRTLKRRRTVVESSDEDSFKTDDNYGYPDDGCDTPSAIKHRLAISANRVQIWTTLLFQMAPKMK